MVVVVLVYDSKEGYHEKNLFSSPFWRSIFEEQDTVRFFVLS